MSGTPWTKGRCLRSSKNADRDKVGEIKMSEKNEEPLSDEEKQARWDEFCKYRDQAWEDITSSSDEFDKSLLTYSSGALGLSLAFIKDIVKLENATALPWLYWSWVFLTLCIILTISSYRFSIEAQKKHLINAQRFFLERDENALNRKTIWSILLDVCAYAGAAFFLAGVLSTVLFVYLNVSQESKMPKATDGRAPMNMTPTANVERGRAPKTIIPTVPVAKPATVIVKPAATNKK
jgi:hypothetical protein